MDHLTKEAENNQFEKFALKMNRDDIKHWNLKTLTYETSKFLHTT